MKSIIYNLIFKILTYKLVSNEMKRSIDRNFHAKNYLPENLADNTHWSNGNSQGYKQVMNMEGGFAAWVDAGLAGDKSVEELKTSSKFHPWYSYFAIDSNNHVLHKFTSL